ncbi:hypothetical protein N7474_002028 [Penicillium riverlandense]|uniref:uncharacterized protein n=1 Tax=Penicillium riverlandense TaxID=1903569 RepID=UPI0025494D20|nr:uncharacterized protein N7474_002028 [Penicillium riverlandense]KAJ5833717.1 hypothetical protein N7474_002028 [Penicillium riverlandense]
MKSPPMSVLETWPTPNYIDPPTRGHGVLVVNVVCISLAFLVVLLRIFTRLRITCSAGVDDVLVVIGLAFSVGMAVVTSIATEEWGWNRHIWDIPPAWLSTVQKLNLCFQIMFSMASGFTKISLLWFCRRLLGASKGNFMLFNWAFIGAMVFVGLSCATFTLISIFQCNPIKAYWQVSPQEPYTCMNDGAIVFSASVINIFTDFLVTALPMPLIWSLKLPARQRLAVISIFGLGVVVNVAGSVRTVYVWKSMVVGYDSTWLGWPVLVAAAVEINLGLICCSAPALRPLIAAFLPHLLQSTRNISYNYGPRSRSKNNLFSSTGRSRNSRLINDDSRQPGYDDRFAIMRTVEMEHYVETCTPGKGASGHAYNITSETTRAITPADSFERKNSGTMYTSATSDASSSTLPRDGVGFAV